MGVRIVLFMGRLPKHNSNGDDIFKVCFSPFGFAELPFNTSVEVVTPESQLERGGLADA